MSELHVYANEVIEWVIAKSPEDAKKVWAEFCTSDGQYSDECGEFEICSDDMPLTFMLDDYAGPGETHTCREWVEIKGRSYLASTEY